MAGEIQKMIVVPVDGTKRLFRSLDFINLIFGPEHTLRIVLFYVLPRLPPILVEESRTNTETANSWPTWTTEMPKWPSD